MRSRKQSVHRDPSRAGSALFLSLVAVSVIAILAVASLRMSAAVTQRQSQAVWNKMAFDMAEAGLAEAYAGIRIGRTGNVGSPEAPAKFGNGLFWVEVTDLGDGRLELESIGMAGSGRATLSAVVEAEAESVATLGMFSSDRLDLPPGVLIDAYDSRLGSYADQVDDSGGGDAGGAGSGGDSFGGGWGGDWGGGWGYTTTDEPSVPARVGSNGAATVTGTTQLPSEVRGDLRPGPEQQVSLQGAATVTGSTEPRAEQAALPAVVVPVVVMDPGIQHEESSTLIIPAGDKAYEFLSVGPNARVVVQGPSRIVLDGLHVAGQGQITFDTEDGGVELIVSQELNLAAGAAVATSSEDPSQVVIQVGGPATVGLHAGGAFHGLLYAPETTVVVGSDFEVFGALVADHLTLTSGVRLHFDLGFVEAVAEESSTPTILSWRLLELAQPKGAPGKDPFTILGIDESTLVPPARAHEDVQIDIQYVDTSGSSADYQGSDCAFDWGQVKLVEAFEYTDPDTDGDGWDWQSWRNRSRWWHAMKIDSDDSDGMGWSKSGWDAWSGWGSSGSWSWGWGWGD